MDWFRRKKAGILTDRNQKNDVPDGYWVNCPNCKEIVNRRELIDNLNVCPECQYHFQLDSEGYFRLLFDQAHYEPLFQDVRSIDPLKFVDRKPYAERLLEAEKKNPGLGDAVRAAGGTIGGHPTSVAAMDFGFVGGSMGSAVGEVLTRTIQRAHDEKTALIIVSQSGGARMMEGAYSLMQMAKTSANLARFSECKLPYISIMTHPTTGGVTASFAMLGDFHLAEPGALIGFAGPRVIRETIGKDLPDNFQTSEFLLEKGFLDRIVHRKNLRETVTTLLDLVA
ncbi:MAG: acetyl-CoA carboxylase, carboxyltransferase subunit beta [Rhodothermales bacterium]|jgi:acetyl-CoA carboxylase carboxyl transferase subunit beta